LRELTPSSGADAVAVAVRSLKELSEMALVLKEIMAFELVHLVNALRKSADATVAAEAKKLRAKWRDEARQAEAEKKAAAAAVAAAAAAQSAVEVCQCRLDV